MLCWYYMDRSDKCEAMWPTVFTARGGVNYRELGN